MENQRDIANPRLTDAQLADLEPLSTRHSIADGEAVDGVYYAATHMELMTCRGDDVIVVGGGNSAGQAAMFLAGQTRSVTIVLRSGDLYKSMSSYLADRIPGKKNIEVLYHTEIRAMHGERHLESVEIEDTSNNTKRTLPAAGVFTFIGASPRTDWLPETISTDARGFIRTGAAAATEAFTPSLLETSVPGIFAAGDVRSGSTKRVASAVGEGRSPHHTTIMLAAEPAPCIRPRAGVVLLFLLISLSACRTDAPPTLDLSAYFSGMDATFILIDGRDSTAQIHNRDRAQVGFLPASTFKIPNTVIALETGVADGPDFRLEWDSSAVPRQAWWPDSWSQHHTLQTALPASVVWFYQEIARRIGPDRMADYLRRFDYGNADITGGIDQLWLSGDLRISAEEQVDFLQRFFHGRIGAAPATTTLAKELLVLEDSPTFRLSGKTGLTGQGDGKPDIGWFVGYVERENAVSFFALNMDVHEDEHIAARTAIARAILVDMGLIDAE